jgi:hypothetical protein
MDPRVPRLTVAVRRNSSCGGRKGLNKPYFLRFLRQALPFAVPPSSEEREAWGHPGVVAERCAADLLFPRLHGIAVKPDGVT